LVGEILQTINQRIKTHLKNIPGVLAVNTARPTISLESTASSTALEYEDRAANEKVIAQTIDFNYPEMMEMKLLKGRFLSEKYASDTINNIVINETLAKMLGIYDDPINKKLKGDQKKTDLDYNVVLFSKSFSFFNNTSLTANKFNW